MVIIRDPTSPRLARVMRPKSTRLWKRETLVPQGRYSHDRSIAKGTKSFNTKTFKTERQVTVF